jgi:hypothetical protein
MSMHPFCRHAPGVNQGGCLDVAAPQEEIQSVRNSNPKLLETREAVAHMQQVSAAEEVLLGRKAALAQLQDVLEIAAQLQLPAALGQQRY